MAYEKFFLKKNNNPYISSSECWEYDYHQCFLEAKSVKGNIHNKMVLKGQMQKGTTFGQNSHPR